MKATICTCDVIQLEEQNFILHRSHFLPRLTQIGTLRKKTKRKVMLNDPLNHSLFIS